MWAMKSCEKLISSHTRRNNLIGKFIFPTEFVDNFPGYLYSMSSGGSEDGVGTGINL